MIINKIAGYNFQGINGVNEINGANRETVFKEKPISTTVTPNDEFIKTPSFMAKPSAKKLTQIATTAATALGITTLVQTKKTEFSHKEIEDARKQLYNILKNQNRWFYESDITDRHVIAFLKNPRLVKGLLAEKNKLSHFAYSVSEAIYIAEVNGKNPKLAYNLTSIFRNNLMRDNQWEDLYQINDLAQMYIQDPKTVKKYGRPHPFQTYEILKLRNRNPEFFDRARKTGIFISHIEQLYDLYNKSPEIVENLAFDFPLILSNEQIEYIIPNFDKKLTFELAEILANLKHQCKRKEEIFCALHESYLKYPDSVRDLIDWATKEKKYGIQSYLEIPYYAEANSIAPDLLKETIKEDRTSSVFEDFNEEKLAKFVITKKQLEPLFKALKEVNPDIDLSNERLVYTINTINNNRIAFLRMIQDGRCDSLIDMVNLVELYNTYPDKKITNKMIKDQEGIKQFFKLDD